MSEPHDDLPTRDARPRGASGRAITTMRSTREGDKDEAGETADLLAAVVAARASRYRRTRERASGGMGTVFVARDAPLARTLVLKVHHEHLSTHREHVEMFLREARITGQLDHPHVVPVHDIGVDDGRLFFAMKLVEGRTLLDWIRSSPGRGVSRREELLDVLDVIIKVCDALAFAHDKGILHCDVKPANVMVGEFGQVYLMDWGVARLIDEERARPDDEDTAKVVGTPTHMPPEQARGAPLDERADVFAVGALLYHVLTGRPPYSGGSTVQVLAQAFLGRFPTFDEVCADAAVPIALRRIVLKAMARERDDRYRSILALKEALVRFARGGESFEAVTYAPGAEVVREGEAGATAFIIEEGRCEVLKAGERIRVMGPGEVFGEMAILSRGARTATVRALERSVLRKVSEATLREELASMKPWMGALVHALADRFREREEGASTSCEEELEPV